MRPIRIPDFTLRSHRLFENGIKNAERMKDDDDDVLNTIVMTCASAEAFVNEADYMSALEGLQKDRLDQHGRLIRIKGENFHKKYSRVLSAVMPSFSQHNDPFQCFETLAPLRNRIVHQNYLDELATAPDAESSIDLKAHGFFYAVEDSPTQITMPNDIKKLDALHLLKKVPKDSYYSWFDLIKTERLAWWCCRSTRDAITNVLANTSLEFGNFFKVWRPLAVAELPALSLQERLETDSDLKAMEVVRLGGAPSFVYTVTPSNEILFSAAIPSEKSGSTINYAEGIIDAIIDNEGINPDDYTFFDLQTHIGYSTHQSGEYTVLSVSRASNSEKTVIEKWEEIKEARILDRKLHLFKGPKDHSILKTVPKFQSFIGKAAPF